MNDRVTLGQQLKLITEFIGTDRPNYRATPISPKFITVHNTSNASPGANAKAHSRFVRETGYYKLKSGKKNYVSWHYTVDDAFVIKQHPINKLAIHAGRNGNAQSIAIEVCMNSDIDQVAADERAAKLVAALLIDLKLPIDAVVTHNHWTNKNCPILLLKKWGEFIGLVTQFRNSASGSNIVPKLQVLETRELEVPENLEALERSEEIDPGDIDHDEMAAAVEL